MKSKILIFLLLTLLTINSCKKDKIERNYTIDDIFTNAEQNKNLRCLIVYKGNQIIKEKYFIGDSLTAHDVRSVTKSVMSTLIGIAIDKGYIESEDQVIGNYLAPLDISIDEAKANIKIRDLLSMSSGLEGSDLTSVSEYENWHHAQNQLLYTLAKPLINQPEEVFAYNSGASHLLSIILTQATGMSTFQFAKKYLFEPLNIDDHYWEQDNQDNYNGSAGLCLTPHDMLKIGQIYLNKGKYNEVQIVSEEWINKVSTIKISTNNMEPFGPNYGYLWWIGNAYGHDYFFANGYGGQFIVITPDLNLIVVATNNWSGVSNTITNQQWYTTLDIVINKIIPLYEQSCKSNSINSE